jgi:multicomponent Na+:H+ antiporter subunit D
LAVYSLLRGFAGYEPLITVGCVMATVPLVYAVIEPDIRRALAYCLLNQLGFMVVAVGVGSPLAIDGAAAHAVAHVLYKGLLFMAAGAVLWRTGTAQASRLGGLTRRMPLTFGCYLVGVAAISAPLFSGFVTKSLTLSAVAQAEHLGAWLSLLAATAGVFLVCGLRLTADVFVKGEPTPLARPLPWNMGAAMVATAICCLLIGLFPTVIYRQLPYDVSYHAYTLPHVVEQLQLMAFAGLAFVGLVTLGFYPWSIPGGLWDLDWIYRRRLPVALVWLRNGAIRIQQQIQPRLDRWWRQLLCWLALQLADDGRRGRFAATGRMAMAAAVMLVTYLLLYLLS